MQQIETPRLTVNVHVAGEGPRLLFLGGSSFDLGLAPPVFSSALATRFTIAAADPRGLGRTDQPDGDWTMQDYALDALALLDALGWSEAVVLGESFGGMTALHLAGLAPHRVRRLALAVAAPGGPGERSYPIHEFRDIPDPHDRAARILQLQDRRFATLAPEAQRGRIEDRVNAERRFLAHAANARGHPRLLAARAAHDARHHLAAIAVPTLVLSGRFDDQSPLSLSQALVRCMPQAELSLHDEGHGLLFRDPAALSAVLTHFVDSMSA
ncbi:alpha/beta fold hydrolase [Roseicyclus marinus]|uniref:alpha/beta fold hydrolase n=1 Tax=Roseicyclus marinus TaxID=2161673 RepID=UPI00240F9D1E|nr:alpha/beta hydrolase [Roseicyclus marinus]MDG3043138.1 alpha/beta hydrolase [Roseicyclus marinus]